MKAILLLEDGFFIEGKGFGARCEKFGEVVFNTSMTGYQEIATDPSYNEQIIIMTYPQIGNYGVNPDDTESTKCFISGFVVKENCSYPSNWRCEETLDSYFKREGIPGIEDVDTRMLVRRIREKGAMKGILSVGNPDVNKMRERLKKYEGLVGRDIVKDVTCNKKYKWKKGVYDPYTGKHSRGTSDYRIAVMDYGVKNNILRLLRSSGFDLTVFPASTPAEKVLSSEPDGIFLSNGPGDPSALDEAVRNIQKMLGKVPIFGICLGHQLLALALGGNTYKLKFGHRGANHPVKNLETEEVEITSQNHGFCVDLDSLKGRGVQSTHINLNDKTSEGLKHSKHRAFSVQYHPEASPGPHDSVYLFSEFRKLIEESRN